MRSVIAACLLVTSTAAANQFEIATGFMRGEWQSEGVIRGLTALDVSGAWLHEQYRLQLSGRMLTSVRDDAGACEPDCSDEAADERHDPLIALAGGWFGEWGGGMAGLAIRGRDTNEREFDIALRPSIAFRIGPRSVHLSGTLWEPGAWLPAPGHTRIGVGSRLNRLELWAGWITDETQRSGGAIGVRAALAERLALDVGAGLSASPSELLLLRVGLSFVLGGDDPPWPSESTDDAPKMAPRPAAPPPRPPGAPPTTPLN